MKKSPSPNTGRRVNLTSTGGRGGNKGNEEGETSCKVLATLEGIKKGVIPERGKEEF